MELNGEGEVATCGSFLSWKRKVVETNLTMASDGCKWFSLPLKKNLGTNGDCGLWDVMGSGLLPPLVS